MRPAIRHLLQFFRPTPAPWDATAPVREDLFGIDRLEQHAESLAAAQAITGRPPRVLALQARLTANAAALLSAYRVATADTGSGRGVVPAAEWLLDNYYLVEKQIRQMGDDLPPGYYRQLPKLATGPFAGYPRVLGLAWAFVAHTDSFVDPETLRRFISAYQRVQPLTIGELWAIPITLRIVLIENLRRLADQIILGRDERADADALADRLLLAGGAEMALHADVIARSPSPLSEVFAAQLAKRLRDQDPRTMPALDWLAGRLARQGLSIDDVVLHAQQRLGASNLSVRNVVTSLQLIPEIDWAELFSSVSLVDARLSAASAFAAMDFPTRNLYRTAIEELAFGSSATELQVVDAALAAAQTAVRAADREHRDRVGDPGYHLIAEGREALERTIGFRPTLRRRFGRLVTRLGLGGYVGLMLGVAAMLVAAALWLLASWGAPPGWLVAFALLAFVPASEAAGVLVNRAVAWSVGARALPGLGLEDGIPTSLRTLVVVPTLLIGEADLRQQVERLEVHHLAGASGDLTFALLTDGIDADRDTLEQDGVLLAVAAAAIAQLNKRYGSGPAGDRFLLLHRRRLFNPGEGVWMGWERKRGKLHELNRLLRGAQDTTFVAVAGQPPRVPDDVRFVITLDADTRLPRDAAARLVGKMAHPLNRPLFDRARRRVVRGYAILQPRVTPLLPLGREGSLYQRIFSGPAGLDPYAAAISDVYQDLFGEGSYTGKGIYDVDAFHAALDGRVPENAMLSHDLFEGVFARAGLASDIEVVEEFPSRYDVASKRQHRWIRGDWQLLPWILDGRPGILTALGRWKMIDNLRRSLVAPALLGAVALCWLLPLPAAVAGLMLLLAIMAIPVFLPSAFAILPARAGLRVFNHVDTLARGLGLAAAQLAVSLTLLPDQAWRSTDAIVRTLWRLFRTRRHLLEWTTSAKSTSAPRLGLGGFHADMAGSTALGVGLAAAALALALESWPVVIPLALAWAAAPVLAMRLSRASRAARRLVLSPGEAAALRDVGRRTWRYFETFVTPADNMLPPDNFQEDPRPVLAHRTSPTNMGLYLLAAVAARDAGWAGTTETLDRIEATLATMHKLARFKGHFFNWYDTQDLRTLDPHYVSSVDSGNLAGHLLALANACDEWAEASTAPDIRAGLTDGFRQMHEAAGRIRADGAGAMLAASVGEIGTLLAGSQPTGAIVARLRQLAAKAAGAARDALPAAGGDEVQDLLFWIGVLDKATLEHDRDAVASGTLRDQRCRQIAAGARDLALGMDFAFLIDPTRKLLSIGYSLNDRKLDANCYDLLASEARLASLFAIAKGDAPTRHWFRLGRSATPLGSGSALISWSGSMFEYLMPSLVMRAPVGTILEQTSRLVVARQQAYATALGLPWGISESAYNARDIEFTYQYSNFGVPGLGLKRGLSADLVIAPYATALAAMVDPQAALVNFARLADMGVRGRYGFYEAVDFTRSRVPAGQKAAIVRNFMAHHQGMTIVAIANTLQDGRMRARFHAEPMIKACDLLLQERAPPEVFAFRPHADEGGERPTEPLGDIDMVRRPSPWADGPPATHLLSNGRYSVMLTATGAGYSRWQDLALTRWREDATCSDRGSFIFLRDCRDGQVWSAARQPGGRDPDDQHVIFGEDHARFVRRDGTLTTTMDVLVSGEDDGEVRRLSLINNGRRSLDIELTSYAEMALAVPAADLAHPAFSKLFVQTEFLAEFGALVATRRPRSPDEPRVWVAHFAVVEGEVAGEPQYETDRARFLGRGLQVADAAAMRDGQGLSGTVGTVLDPVFALRQRVTVRPGQTTRIAFWMVAAATRDDLIDLIDRHHDRNAYDRALVLAWTQGQVQLRHLGIAAAEAADFQRLATPILFADRRFRAPADVILAGAGPQSGLWRQGISGDRPIVVLRLDDVADIALLGQLLRAHEYWRMKRLAVDLVIVNEHAASYQQDLQVAIERAVRSSQSRPRRSDESVQGEVHVLRADLIGPDTRSLLLAVARVVLHAGSGPIADQLARIRLPAAALSNPAPRRPGPAASSSSLPHDAASLEFFNGQGGFSADGREYVTVLEGGATTPAPWINVVANDGFGFQVSAEGSAFVWAENSRENQVTPWSNDPVADPVGEAIYVRDEATGEFWGATARPAGDGGTYVARHGFGYSRFEHEARGIALDLLLFVPLADPVRIARLTLHNRSDRRRRLSVTAYAEWVMGTARSASAPFIVTSIDPATGALLARNPWNGAFPGRVAFADLGGRQTSWTADRTEFLGRHGGVDAPAALVSGQPLSGATGPGLDPCATLAAPIELGIGETVEVVWLIGQCGSSDEAAALVRRYRAADLDATLAAVTGHWDGLLGAVRVKTPDRAMDVMLNGWLLYQTLACRILARAGFYQAGGAYGFRDQLQDGMALSLAAPQETRRHLLRAAARQFQAGDVQHWWLPHSGQGVRTRISDDRVWLVFAAANYVATSGDTGVLDEAVPFLAGRDLLPGEHDAFFEPSVTDERASLFEHCALALDQAMGAVGAHGLPLMGTGDWNDGMNRVGQGGQGESVWLGWLAVRAVALFAPLAEGRAPERGVRWRAQAAAMTAALEREAWDGEWYRRATFDDGTWLGSRDSEECRIDAISQSWAVLSGVADPVRAARAMASLDQQLIRRDDGLALLFTPPFDRMSHDPGYIKGYPPGLRENGGQYSHAAMWNILARAEMGDGAGAVALFAMLNPINHARTAEAVARYKVEPYVVAADIYSVAPHVGRGGWTWYTGSAAWMYRAGVEGILGIRRNGACLTLDPRLPPDWPGFSATVTVAGTRYDIEVVNPVGAGGGRGRLVLDGLALAIPPEGIRLPLDRQAHVMKVELA